MLRIGFSYAPDDGPYPSYHNAVLAAAARLGVELGTCDLSARTGSTPIIDGIVFTGGADIDPARYGKAANRSRCDTMDAVRDEAEFKLCEVARTRQLPILAICRGMQLLKVAFGGDLIADLQTAASHTKKDGNDSRHGIVTVAGSCIAHLAGERAEVNSSHHQAVDRLAEDFVVSARADDGVIEAFEWAESLGKPFLLAVQWHPERMHQSSVLSGPLFEQFLSAVSLSSAAI